MANLESPEEKEFKKVVCDIRSAGNYYDSLNTVREKLNLPDSTTEYETEALLIHATREQFGENLDADMVLMALGLLNGFDNPHNPSEYRSCSELITERRRMFLKMSSYVADRHNSNNKRRAKHYESYEELEAAGKDAIDAVVSALGSDDAARIKKVAKKIYSRRRSIAEYLKEANKYLIYDKKGNIVDVKLQELKNIRQEPTDDNGDNPTKPNPPEPPIPKPDSPSDIQSKLSKTANWLKISAIAFVSSIFAFAIIEFLSFVIAQRAISLALEDPKVDQKPYSILFTNSEEWLPFGKTKNLTVKPEPADATLDGLRCKSEGNNAHIIEILSEPGLHIKAINESEDSEKCDVEVKAYMDYNEIISDVVTIHVIKDGENESTGEGELDGKTSGDFSQMAD